MVNQLWRTVSSKQPRRWPTVIWRPSYSTTWISNGRGASLSNSRPRGSSTRARRTDSYTHSILSIRPDTLIFHTRYPGVWQPVRELCWLLIAVRGLKRRHSPTSTSPSKTISKSSPSSTKSISRPPTPTASRKKSKPPSASIAPTLSSPAPNPESASPTCSSASSRRSPRHPQPPTADPSEPSSLIPITTPTGESLSSSVWWTGRSGREIKSGSSPAKPNTMSRRWASCNPTRSPWMS
mmetsp:Transcript_9576/g.13778  ORF Transcript_9576/g.13778 Transcript_9576/m.13778 type:complete len:238 (+) Transcript_9576:56-769(+)